MASRYEIYIKRLDRGDLMALDDAQNDPQISAGQMVGLTKFTQKVLDRYNKFLDIVAGRK